ncbi:hypothetical protein BST81_04550 [Leptolyngbya sp. 'hensonii']|uniref:hypothetical protein n=1 Tax=Leptolyngbya sp. 'hensonii' TaxID=1922337 RepID=UPI00094FF2E2|nr:hypothetical protein [Leptolyngbya sp. 'hensonii']OLP19545.1 hypothetical protein BST81_04550 [Leptolyngbya sp. 'hensonii']
MGIPNFQGLRLARAIAGATIVLTLAASKTLAQSCGQYGLFLNVLDEVGNPVHGVYPRLTPTGEHTPQDSLIVTSKQFERTTEDYRGFQFLLEGNEQPKGTYTLYVTAADYLPFEREIAFPYCRNQRIDIRLRLQSGKKPVLRKKPVKRPAKKPAANVPQTKALPFAADNAL